MGDYLELPELMRRSYAAGMVNGMLLAPLFGAPKPRLAWFENCIEGMTDVQVAEIVYQYAKGRPAEWHQGLNTFTYNAFIQACPGSVTGKRK